MTSGLTRSAPRATVAVALLGACFGGGGNTPGTERGPCFPNDTCNDGLMCVNDRCVRIPDAAPPDAYVPPDAYRPPDAYVPPDAYIPPDAPFACGADSVLEPNESISDPTVTPIDAYSDTYELIGVQICPYWDIDVFRFTTETAGRDATVTIDFDYSAGALELDILNSSGVSIATGTSSGNPDILSATVLSLPIGVYYARVQAATTAVENDYDIYFALAN